MGGTTPPASVILDDKGVAGAGGSVKESVRLNVLGDVKLAREPSAKCSGSSQGAGVNISSDKRTKLGPKERQVVSGALHKVINKGLSSIRKMLNEESSTMGKVLNKESSTMGKVLNMGLRNSIPSIKGPNPHSSAVESVIISATLQSGDPDATKSQNEGLPQISSNMKSETTSANYSPSSSSFAATADGGGGGGGGSIDGSGLPTTSSSTPSPPPPPPAWVFHLTNALLHAAVTACYASLLRAARATRWGRGGGD